MRFFSFPLMPLLTKIKALFFTHAEQRPIVRGTTKEGPQRVSYAFSSGPSYAFCSGPFKRDVEGLFYAQLSCAYSSRSKSSI